MGNLLSFENLISQRHRLSNTLDSWIYFVGFYTFKQRMREQRGLRVRSNNYNCTFWDQALFPRRFRSRLQKPYDSNVIRKNKPTYFWYHRFVITVWIITIHSNDVATVGTYLATADTILYHSCLKRCLNKVDCRGCFLSN